MIPGIQTSISKQVANYGLLERENATILNASLLPFASTTVRGFQTAARKMGLPCPFFVTGNDGTLLTLSQAARLPIKTFSSGPTNSMRGANFLAQLSDKKARRETALVVDIGGTTVSHPGLVIADCQDGGWSLAVSDDTLHGNRLWLNLKPKRIPETSRQSSRVLRSQDQFCYATSRQVGRSEGHR